MRSLSEALDLVVVTGAGRGIGRAIALAAGRTGVPTLCIGRTENASRVAEEIGPHAQALRVDLGDPERARARVAAWVEGRSYPRIGVVLAAATLGPTGAVDHAPISAWDEVYRVNVVGNLAVLSALLPGMRAHRFGRIVGFGGGGAAYAYPLFPAYAASKAAMVRTIENVAEELRDKGDFSAVCLAPGAVETDMLAAARAAGGEVRTVVDISEPVAFVTEFLAAESCAFSGAFVHVRDAWRELLKPGAQLEPVGKWKLRRVD